MRCDLAPGCTGRQSRSAPLPFPLPSVTGGSTRRPFSNAATWDAIAGWGGLYAGTSFSSAAPDQRTALDSPSEEIPPRPLPFPASAPLAWTSTLRPSSIAYCCDGTMSGFAGGCTMNFRPFSYAYCCEGMMDGSGAVVLLLELEAAEGGATITRRPFSIA